MLQALVLIEKDALIVAEQLAPKPDVLVIRELADETPRAFAERVVKRLVRESKEGLLDLCHYFVGNLHGGERFASRYRIMRKVLESSRSDANLTFMTAGSDEIQVELFSLVDALREALASGYGLKLRFTRPAVVEREPELRASA
jgi:hypothetical protein